MNYLSEITRKSGVLLNISCGLLLLGSLLISSAAFSESVEHETMEEVTPDSGASIALLPAEELEELVAPIALYPDDLLGIVLPASTFPLQIVQAARYLEARGSDESDESDESLEPDKAWDDSIIALLNYPEALDLLNKDLNWTWELGEAVLNQHQDLLTAVTHFRELARVAGNLESDEHQTVEVLQSGTIEIRPADPEVIYVPYYEPSRVIVYSSRPVYHYYPHAYPVYYYPYSIGYQFSSLFFWGVTSAFTIDWNTRHLHVHHYGYDGHPYYGRRYNYDYHYYRRPVVSIGYYQNFNHQLARHHEQDRDHNSNRKRERNHDRNERRHHAGNYWQPKHKRGGARPRSHDSSYAPSLARLHRGSQTSSPKRGSVQSDSRNVTQRRNHSDQGERAPGSRKEREGFRSDEGTHIRRGIDQKQRENKQLARVGKLPKKNSRREPYQRTVPQAALVQPSTPRTKQKHSPPPSVQSEPTRQPQVVTVPPQQRNESVKRSRREINKDFDIPVSSFQPRSARKKKSRNR